MFPAMFCEPVALSFDMLFTLDLWTGCT